MIVRDDITAETYCPLPFSGADLRDLERAIKDRVGKLLTLDLGYTDTGAPFLTVTEPEFAPEGEFDDALIITRNKRGWQMHRGGDGPLYEFATEQEVAEFLGCGLRSKA